MVRRGSKFQIWTFRLFVAFCLAICLGYLPYQAYGINGIARAMHLESDLNQLVNRNEIFHQENQQLRQRIKQLKNDRKAIEHVARDELGLVKHTDIVYQIR